MINNNNYYQSINQMDDFNIIIDNNSTIIKPVEILKSGQKIQISSNIDIIEQINSKLKNITKKQNEEQEDECIKGTIEETIEETKEQEDNEFLKAVKYIYEMKDEDDEREERERDSEEIKEKQRLEKEKRKWESKRLAELHSASNKFKNERKALVQQYIADGYDEKIIKLCKECQLRKPKHPLFFPLNTNQKQIEQGWIYGSVCLDCVESFEDKKIQKELDRKSKCFAYTCKCGIELTISETTRLHSEAYYKHTQTKHHKQYEIIMDNKTNNDIPIDFSLFSIAQLRYIIKSNKTDTGKCLASYYGSMNKKDIVKLLDENRDYINVSLDVLKIINAYKK